MAGRMCEWRRRSSRTGGGGLTRDYIRVQEEDEEQEEQEEEQEETKVCKRERGTPRQYKKTEPRAAVQGGGGEGKGVRRRRSRKRRTCGNKGRRRSKGSTTRVITSL